MGGGESRPDPDARIVAWTSADHGYTWTPLPAPIVTGATGHGLWEPGFSEVSGQLVMHFSDKTQQPAYGHTLARVRSADGGRTWSAEVNTVASDVPADSPGMPVVRRLPNGRYVMVYEYCELAPVAGGHGCRVHLRTSPDGWDWGDPRDPGTIIRTADGKHLAHAPTVAWTPGGGPQGRLLMVGKLVRAGGDAGQADVLPESGRTVLVNTANGAGAWYEIDAAGVADAAVYRAVNLGSHRCLDVSEGAVANGTRIQQWACSGAPAQRWRAERRAAGVFSFVNPKSGKCLDVPNGNISVDPGDKVHLWTCNGTGAQDWLPVAVGRSAYLVKPRDNQALCLDVADGSAADGAEARVTPCTNAASQFWHLGAAV
ncbi:RICIN domain-containing protein [[Actinomadura] parvosata]|uniref:RICIN domain-containing protein n=1 Tax=[Actinomadura] parvosata TaxID=1955412 RepID=UPI00406C71E9